jgi:hypothetical protein
VRPVLLQGGPVSPCEELQFAHHCIDLIRSGSRGGSGCWFQIARTVEGSSSDPTRCSLLGAQGIGEGVVEEQFDSFWHRGWTHHFAAAIWPFQVHRCVLFPQSDPPS